MTTPVHRGYWTSQHVCCPLPIPPLLLLLLLLPHQVLASYPLDFTFVCPTELTAFSDRHAEFKALNTEVLCFSVDSQFSHLAWIQTDRKEGEWGRGGGRAQSRICV